jgi:carbamate kinase
MALEQLSVAEARKLLENGHFGKGSMEPKIRAAIMFLEEADPSQKREVIITLPETALNAMKRKTGTRITR